MKKFLKFLGYTFLGLFILGFFFGDSEPKENVYIKIGEPLKTSKFEVTVNKIELTSSVNTGNIFTNLKPEQGVLYLIIDTNFKNIDKESRTIFDGEVLVVSNSNGETLTYDNSETILTDGWGLFLDSINPGLSKRTKLVYKLPSNLSDVTLFYVPYSAPKNTFIFLGKIN